MYIPKYFAEEDQDTLYDFIDRHGFCVLFSTHDGAPVATHLPLTLDRNSGFLYGHFARPNPQWKDIAGQRALAVFQGPHSYISSSWYETPQSVPTWNYVSVHVYGTVELIEDPAELLACLNDLVKQYEEPGSGYGIDETNLDFVRGLSQGIVGFKLKIDRIEGKWKLSQNHSKERRERVIEQLERIPSDNAKGIAKLMRDTLK